MDRLLLKVSVIVGLLGLLTGCVRFGFDADHAPEMDPSAASHSTATPTARMVAASWEHPMAMTTHQVILGIQGKSGSYLRQLSVTGDHMTSLQLLELDLGGSSLRGLARLASGDLLAGNGFTPLAQQLSGASMTSEGTLALGGVNNLHGICTLPGGNLIVGEFGTGKGNRVVEFRPTAGGFAVERPVYTSQLGGGSLSHCAAPSDTELYSTEYGAMDDLDGDVVRLVLEDGTWTETHRFDSSSFALDRHGPDHHTAVYSFVLHTDGWLYIFPLRRHGNRVRGLIRCPTPDITANRCQELGALPPDTSTDLNSPDAIQGAAQVPGSDDLLFATNRRVYRYTPSTDTWVELLDLYSLDWPQADPMRQLRNLVLLEE